MNKSILYFGSFLFLNITCSTQGKLENQRAILKTISEFQNEIKLNWETPETTPLMEDEKNDFRGIEFFPIDLKYRITADFIPLSNGRILPFPTSANKTKYYKEYGVLNFKINDKPLKLTVYASDPPIEGYENSLFLPFMDDTNGETSYGGGRYLDFETFDIKENQLIIDFNKAYNPYCAYSKYYNCPIPPANNYLEIQIKAGEKYSQ